MIAFNDISISCSSVGLFNTTESWSHPMITTKTHEIIYVVNGTFKIMVGDEIFLLEPGSILIMPANITHGGISKTQPETEIKFFWVHFYCDDDKLRTLFPTTLYHMDDVGCSYIFRELMHLQRSGENQLLADIKLAELLVRIHNTNNVNRQTKLIGEIKAYIHANADRRITVNEIAKNFKYNTGYLSRVFKKEAGISIQEYIISERIKYAKAYLLNTTFPIKEVAILCGFDDDNQFVKFFKYNSTHSPTQYRNQYATVHINKR